MTFSLLYVALLVLRSSMKVEKEYPGGRRRYRCNAQAAVNSMHAPRPGCGADRPPPIDFSVAGLSMSFEERSTNPSFVLIHPPARPATTICAPIARGAGSDAI